MGAFDDSGHIASGEVLSLTQPSVRRAMFELRQRDAVVGALDWRRGRRSVASARVQGLGSVTLAWRRRGRTEVRDEGAGNDVAIVDWDRGRTARITVAGKGGFVLRPSGRHRSEILRTSDELFVLRAVQSFARASVEITASTTVPEQTGLLLCVIGGFAALRELRAEVDSGAAVGGIVASGLG